LRQLRAEIEMTQADTGRLHIVAEREVDLAAKKGMEERRIMKLVNDDIKE
jgi:hypothetical protein